jgi:DNA-binding transcriptional MerR regulator
MAEKLYYSMGEVTEMLCVSPSLVRFWEKRFDILRPHKNKKGNRLFSPDDVRNLKTIYHLVKERGMTLAGAERHLKAEKLGQAGVERDVEIAERLGSIRAMLLEVLGELGGGGIIVSEVVAEEVAPVKEPPLRLSADIPPQEENLPSQEVAPIAPEPVFIEQTLF